MAEYSRFFGGPAGSVPSYTQPQFAEVLKRIFSNGVFYSVGNKLAVTETDPVSLAVKVNTGEAWINGFWYQNDAALTKTLATADTTYDRIDRIVLKLDTVTYFKISCEVLTGTPAASPIAPALTQNANVYEISLAQVLVNANATSISNAKITDERTYIIPNEGVGNIGNQAISGVKTFTDGLKTDTVNEAVAGAGVTVDNLKIKDNGVESIYNNGNITGSFTINWLNGFRQKATLTGNVTLDFSNPVEGRILELFLLEDATGGRTISFTPTITWQDATTPTWTTTASKLNVISLRYIGTSYYGIGAKFA